VQALLAIMTAFLWGAGNFSMGIASKRHAPRLAVLAGFSAGLLGAFVFLAVAMPDWQQRAFLWGALSGLAQGAGWGVLSFAMSVGRVSVLAPIAAAGCSAFVFVAGLASGDEAGAFAFGGAALVLVAVVLLTSESDEEVKAVLPGHQPRAVSRRAPLLAVVAAACFALQAICLDRVSDQEASVVMTGARVAVVALIGLSLLLRPARARGPAKRLWPAVVGGVILLLGDIVYLAALREGPLSVAGVISGANPAVTIVLAALVLRERLRLVQLGGIALALAGSALLAAG
jgi:drug/metabolite transporter (DMT)-like permease